MHPPKTLITNIAAVILALVGAGLLVCTYFPILNPGLYHAETGTHGQPLIFYVIGTAVAIPILCVALFLSKRAQRLSEQETPKAPKNEPLWQQITKWLLLIAIVLLMIYC